MRPVTLQSEGKTKTFLEDEQLYERLTSPEGVESHGTAVSDRWSQAQTFTVGATGTNVTHDVTSVDLHVMAVGEAVGLKVSIQSVDSDGKPTGDILCSGVIPKDNIPPHGTRKWKKATFDSPATLQKGQMYAIVVEPNSPGDHTDLKVNPDSTAYPDGTNWRNNGSGWENNYWDFLFREYGTPSPPGEGAPLRACLFPRLHGREPTPRRTRGDPTPRLSCLKRRVGGGR